MYTPAAVNKMWFIGIFVEIKFDFLQNFIILIIADFTPEDHTLVEQRDTN